MSRAKFSIIIPCNRLSDDFSKLHMVLQACLNQVGVSGGLEIFLVNNLKDEALEKEFSGENKINFITAGRIGVNAARNLGAKCASGDYLLFLDDDCVLPTNTYLADLEQVFLNAPAFSVLGGGYISAELDSWRVRGYNSMTNLWITLSEHDSPQLAEPSRVKNLLGGNVCYKKEIFSAGFFFEEKIISGGDETEFHHRLNSAGFLLGYDSRLSVIHRANGSWLGLVMRAWKQGAARGRADSEPLSMSYKKYKLLLRGFWQEPALFFFSCAHFPFLKLASAISFSKKN